jgi:hypothetical protein
VQNIVTIPTAPTHLTTNSSSTKHQVFHAYNTPPLHQVNTQRELHNHRLNMMDTNLIQSSRIFLLESKINQGQQNASFHLELPSLAAYHAQPPPVLVRVYLCSAIVV